MIDVTCHIIIECLCVGGKKDEMISNSKGKVFKLLFTNKIPVVDFFMFETQTVVIVICCPYIKSIICFGFLLVMVVCETHTVNHD